MAGLFGNIFGGTPPIVHNGGNSAPQPLPTPTVVNPGNSNNTANGGDGIKNDGGNNNTPKEPSSPLDKFTTFWDTPKDADGKPIAAATDPNAADIYNFDPKKVSESAGKLNFLADVSPELLKTAISGGDGAAEALVAVINKATQTAFAAGTINSGKLINDGIKTGQERFKSTLPRHIKEVQLSQTGATNPVLAHPAATPIVDALKAAAFARNPNADPAKVTAEVEGLLTGLGIAISENTPEAIETRTKKVAGEEDWSTFLT